MSHKTFGRVLLFIVHFAHLQCDRSDVVRRLCSVCGEPVRRSPRVWRTVCRHEIVGNSCIRNEMDCLRFYQFFNPFKGLKRLSRYNNCSAMHLQLNATKTHRVCNGSVAVLCESASQLTQRNLLRYFQCRCSWAGCVVDRGKKPEIRWYFIQKQ